ncbi:hypothetical protein SDC9_158492 [bioreactor metagenome]|uniref:Uncharacterized protein n=1 Tax=bioreactor metagenome TaxID=1076179 RepID=A0A645FA56_9ZZZZ
MHIIFSAQIQFFQRTPCPRRFTRYLIISEVNVLRQQPSGIGRLLLAHVFGLKIPVTKVLNETALQKDRMSFQPARVHHGQHSQHSYTQRNSDGGFE